MKPERLQHLLKSARGRRLLVIGDVMLDEFVWGRVSRISPEAPVPVVEVQSESCYPGGAANVARNLRAFCAGVGLCGLVGADLHAERLREIIENEGILSSGLLVGAGMPTIVKTRIIARHQQVVRVDREKRFGDGAGFTGEAVARIRGMLPDFDGVIIEDYGKGFITQGLKDEVCAMVRAAGKLVFADPNPGNAIDWRGVDLLKPNRSEAFAMAGAVDPGAGDDPMSDVALREVGAVLGARWGLRGLLVTLGEHGMMLFEEGTAAYHTPTRAREVFDVSGAGDTAIALFSLAVCAGATMREAAEISNHASGVVVGKLGTATLSPEELAGSFLKDASGGPGVGGR